MKYKVFEEILNKIEEMHIVTDKLYGAGLDITNILNPYDAAINHLFGAYYGNEGKEWIEWFLYEKAGQKGMKAYDGNGKEICRTKKELWQLIELERTDDYKLTKQLTSEQRDEIIKSMMEGFKDIKL